MQPGDVLSHYQILEPIGKGGMGEVFRAKDSKLGRDVAIKVLPDELAHDDERLRRFQREAEVLASLNHANIAGIHGLEESDGIKALVLELVDGPTLAERIARGPMPVDEAVAIAKQIAEALEAGHEAGIVHRDLKPANVKLKEDGTVKVLDYGLAKAFEGDGAVGGDDDLSQSPTLTRQGTQVGVILGTAAYMSPEQAKGKRVDKRTDIFAFGAVLYEMLTGKKAFPGEDVSETLAAVIRAEPDWSRLPRVPARVDVLLRRCLDKDAKRRLRDIGEARVALDNTDVEVADAPATSHVSTFAWAAGALALGLVVGAVAMKSSTPSVDPTPRPVVRFDIRVPETSGHLPTVLAMTPDESRLVFARASGETQQLYVRPLDEEAFTPIPGTEGGNQPFLSPDGEWLGFHADGQLKKVRLSGGPTAVLCELGSFNGATWVDDLIVFASEGAIWEVPAAGGTPRRLTAEGTSREIVWPDVLPGSKAALFAETAGQFVAFGGGPDVDDHFRVTVVSLATGEERPLIDEALHPRFVPPSHLLFVRDETLWVVPFDLESLELAGEPVPVVEGIHAHGTDKAAQYAVSPNGSLVYSSSSGLESLYGRLVFVDRSGSETSFPHDPGGYLNPRLSPDGQKLAISDGDNSKWDLWILDVDRPARTRLTFDVQGDLPAWTPDGRRVAYASRPTSGNELSVDERHLLVQPFWMPADASGAPEHLLERPSSNTWPYDFHPDGRTLLFGERVSSTNRDIWALTIGEEPKPFVVSDFDESSANFSPDGRWVAYVSNRSGRTEAYLTSYPEPGGAVPVSTDGGTFPAWSPAGGELFYRNGDAMMAVPVQLEPELRIGTPELLFEGSYAPSYDVTFDGQRFVMINREASDASTAQIHVVLNWLQELERVAPRR